MQAHLDQLELVLAQQVAGMTALKNWLPRKIELIKSHQLSELEAFNQREEEQVARLQQAESHRQVLLGLIALELGLDGGVPLTLTGLLPHVPEATRARLIDRGEQLQALVTQLREGQAVVNDLLRVSLQFVHHTMDVFAELATAAPPSGYGAAGDRHDQPAASWLLDHQA